VDAAGHKEKGGARARAAGHTQKAAAVHALISGTKGVSTLPRPGPGPGRRGHF